MIAQHELHGSPRGASPNRGRAAPDGRPPAERRRGSVGDVGARGAGTGTRRRLALGTAARRDGVRVEAGLDYGSTAHGEHLAATAPDPPMDPRARDAERATRPPDSPRAPAARRGAHRRDVSPPPPRAPAAASG